jgi:lysine/ornithine N-monooxygenase
MHFAILISYGAIGPFGVPHFPELYDNFQGKVIHTAKWNVSLEELTNKRVAVVGSGSRYEFFPSSFLPPK